jgi:hypothetical protein
MEFPAPVNTDKQPVGGINFKFQPGTPGRDDSGIKHGTAAGMAFFGKGDTGRTVKLADDHPLGTIYYKGTSVGHQRNFPDIHFLFLDILTVFGLGFTVNFPNDQLKLNLEGGRIGHSPFNAFIFAVFGFVD